MIKIREDQQSFNKKEENFIHLIRHLIKGNVNVVHSHHYQSHIVSWLLFFTFKIFSLFTGRKKIKLVWTIHFDPKRLSKLKVNFLKLLQTIQPSTIIFVSRTVADQWQHCSGDQHIIYNGSKFIKSKTSALKRKINDGANVSLGFIGRDVPGKQLPWFLELAKIHQEKIDRTYCFSFCVMSDATHLDTSTFNINNEAIISKNITFFQPNTPLQDFMNSVDVVLSLSRYESFGLVGVEALSFQKRFYALPLPVYKELFPGQDIFLDVSSPSEFYARLVNFLGQDYPKINLQKFSLDRMLSSYGELYEKIIRED